MPAASWIGYYMNEAPEELKRVCQELVDQGIWPPYSLIVSDGVGGSVHLDVTLTSFKPSGIMPPSEQMDVFIKLP